MTIFKITRTGKVTRMLREVYGEEKQKKTSEYVEVVCKEGDERLEKCFKWTGCKEEFS